MKIKSLLAAVSMAAITAGSASALTIPAPSVTPSGIVPAFELQLPGTPAHTGTFNFDIVTQTGNLPNGNNIFVKIDLPAGVIFSNAVTGASVVAQGPTVLSPYAAPTAATGTAAGTVQGGTGAAGSNSVTLLVSLDSGYNSNTLGLTFDLGLNACPAPGGVIGVTVSTEANNEIEGDANINTPTATTANVIAPCKSALNGVVASDAAVSDTQILLAPYTAIGEVLGTGPLNATGTLGSIHYTIDPTVSTSLASLTSLVVGDIEDINFDVVFENAAAITGVTVGGIAGTKNGNLFRFQIAGATDLGTFTDATPDDVVITVNGTTVIPTQTVTVANARVDFRKTGAPDMILSETGASGALDTLQRQGRSFGFFDWNSGGDGSGTVSVYRITGLSGATDYSVQLANSNANGTYTGTITPDATGEAILFSTDLGGTLPTGVVRYDFLLNLETSSTTVDVDRLLSKGGIVTSFNDGANYTNNAAQTDHPLNDSDNDSALLSE